MLFTKDNLEDAFQWIIDLRKDYSANSDIWNLRCDWGIIKDKLLAQLNDGSYQFSLLDRYEFDDAIITLWSSQDMIALKLITLALKHQMSDDIPKSCYHVKGHGGLKQAVTHTKLSLSNHQFVLRSDIKGYYESIRFDILMGVIESYIQHPVLLTLISKSLRRTETRGGNFYDFHKKGIPMGSPLSPLLGAIALIPLDKAMERLMAFFMHASWMIGWFLPPAKQHCVKLSKSLMRL